MVDLGHGHDSSLFILYLSFGVQTLVCSLPSCVFASVCMHVHLHLVVVITSIAVQLSAEVFPIVHYLLAHHLPVIGVEIAFTDSSGPSSL